MSVSPITEVTVVTIDGPAGVGKTTLAKRMAGELGIAYLDTGAMFRAVAHRLGEGSWNLPGEEISARLEEMTFELAGVGEESVLTLGGRAPGAEIRTEQVGMWGSNIARLPVVREALKQAQRGIAGDTPLVAEGRDMGTVVFPEAALKFFLDASPEERARRRFRQLRELGAEADLERITEQIRARDHQDRTRAVAPLRPADDARVIDTTSLSVDQVFDAMIRAVRDSKV